LKDNLHSHRNTHTNPLPKSSATPTQALQTPLHDICGFEEFSQPTGVERGLEESHNNSNSNAQMDSLNTFPSN